MIENLLKKEWLVKTLALGIVVLFISVSFQPIIAEESVSVDKTSDYENWSFEEAKDYLFQTIINISNNNNVRDLCKRVETQWKESHRFISFDFNYNKVFFQLFIKNPRLFFSIIFTKPSMTYEYFNSSYVKGVKIINFLGEEIALEIVESTRISNTEFYYELNDIIINDVGLSKRILTLQLMNEELKLVSPLKYYPVICACLFIIYNLAVFSLNFMNYLYEKLQYWNDLIAILLAALLLLSFFLLVYLECFFY